MDNNMKKTIIICVTLVLVTVLGLTAVIIIKNSQNKEEMQKINSIGEMSYEDFTFGMKEDLSQEVIDEVKSLYYDFLQALENNDDKAINNVFDKLSKLDVYDEGAMQSGMIEMSPEEFAKLDPDGDGIIVFGAEELPDDFGTETTGGN